MNKRELEEYSKLIGDKPGDWLKELRKRASTLDAHYSGKLNEFRFAGGKEVAPTGLLGNPNGFFMSKDVLKRHQFLGEYMSFIQELSAFGYTDRLKEMEIIDPSAMSNMFTMIFDKRKNLEDRTMQLLGSINQVLKSVISIIYELKELDRNVSFYEKAKVKADPKTAEAGELGLKRIFIDNVDSRKREASLLSLSRAPSQGGGGGGGYIDIVSVFYSIKKLSDIETLNRNEQYKNVLKNRFLEYEDWKKLSEKDLKTRREMLLQYLKSQNASFEMYLQWAYQYMTILKRINLKSSGMNAGSAASAYTNASTNLDVSEFAAFTVNLVAGKQILMKEYDVSWEKAFGNAGPLIPVAASPKSSSVTLETRGGKLSERRFMYDRIKQYGPKVIAAIEAEFKFKEKPFFSEQMPQTPMQYEGALDIRLNPYCFSLDEWYLFKKAIQTQVQSSVFSGLDSVLVTSLKPMKDDLDKYIKEAENLNKPSEKATPSFAFLDIFQSFREDLRGITSELSSAKGSSSGKRASDSPEMYEIAVNNRLNRSLHRDALALGTFVVNEDVSLIYEEAKRRSKLLNSLDHTDIF